MQIIKNEKSNSKIALDFLFICEAKARELESLCLIARELEKCGHSVGLLSFWDIPNFHLWNRIKTKVLIIQSAYTTMSLNRILICVKGYTKIVNMQWEQVYCEKDMDNEMSPWNMYGKTHDIKHLSWGEENYRKLVEYDKIPDENVVVVGNITLDFLRDELKDFYLSKEEIMKEFKINPSLKLFLFISSFSFVNLPNEIMENELAGFMDISVLSQKVILEWIEELLNNVHDLAFVYRPHPAEADNQELKRLASKYSNFYVISDHSVKQWILVADTIYNWYSTSMAEIYFAKKNCFILRPYTIDNGYECTVFLGGHFIDNKEDFLKSVYSSVAEFPISVTNIRNKYYHDEQEPTYVKIARVCLAQLTDKKKGLIYHYTVKDILNEFKRCLKKTWIQ